MPRSRDDLVVRPLLRDRLVGLVPEKHRLARAGSVAIAELAGEPWMAGCPRCRGQLVEVCRAAGFVPRIDFATDDYPAVVGLVGAGLGVAVLPELAIESVRPKGARTVTVEPPVRREIVALTLPDLAQVPAVAATLDRLARAAAADAAQKHGHACACPTVDGKAETFLQLFEAGSPLPVVDAATSRLRATMSSSRSSSVRPPHTPYGSRTARACAAHWARTGHRMQTSWPSSRERSVPHRARPPGGRRASCRPRGRPRGAASPRGPRSDREGGRNLPLLCPLVAVLGRLPTDRTSTI